ncbi:MAG: relaxase domain-containing protein [Thermoleophilaceae bacterium]|nr:relaxase domain-containing protein [Thermoleophilaceae bacterium]
MSRGGRFEHRTSRAIDPQRHSHLLVSNRVRCTDGVWRSIDSRAAHRSSSAFGATPLGVAAKAFLIRRAE